MHEGIDERRIQQLRASAGQPKLYLCAAVDAYLKGIRLLAELYARYSWYIVPAHSTEPRTLPCGMTEDSRKRTAAFFAWSWVRDLSEK